MCSSILTKNLSSVQHHSDTGFDSSSLESVTDTVWTLLKVTMCLFPDLQGKTPENHCQDCQDCQAYIYQSFFFAASDTIFASFLFRVYGRTKGNRAIHVFGRHILGAAPASRSTKARGLGDAGYPASRLRRAGRCLRRVAGAGTKGNCANDVFRRHLGHIPISRGTNYVDVPYFAGNWRGMALFSQLL